MEVRRAQLTVVVQLLDDAEELVGEAREARGHVIGSAPVVIQGGSKTRHLKHIAAESGVPLREMLEAVEKWMQRDEAADSARLRLPLTFSIENNHSTDKGAVRPGLVPVGDLFNHSTDAPNVAAAYALPARAYVYTATQPIAAGDELLATDS